MNVHKSRALLSVRRLNFERCNKYESVAEHSFYVGLLAYELAKVNGWEEPEALLAMKAGMEHDLQEAVTGDWPYLVKRAMDRAEVARVEDLASKELGINPSYPVEVLRLVRYADALEFALYLREERLSGNRALLDIERETKGRLVDGTPSWGFARDLLGDTDWVRMEAKEIPNALKH